MGDGRPWGVSQVLGAEYLPGDVEKAQFVIGGTMGVPQMKSLAHIQPFFYEGTLSVYEPRSMIMEHTPADDFQWPNPQGDFTGIESHHISNKIRDIQSGMDPGNSIRNSFEERRDVMFQELSMRYFGKAFTLRDFQRFVGEWQAHETRLLPNPYDAKAPSVMRGKEIYQRPRTGCSSCHPPPHFSKKDFANNANQSLPSLVPLTSRDAAFTLIGMNKLDEINNYRRDLEPKDKGRTEFAEGHYTTTQLRGIWDRPPVFLHNGAARTLREVLATPNHSALEKFKYAPVLGPEAERPLGKEIGFNSTAIFSSPDAPFLPHIKSGARIGVDTHGGTSHLSARELNDLINFLLSIE
jgi:hypothetical protein